MTIPTEEAEMLANILDDEGGFLNTADALRSLAAERDALRANLDAIVIPTTYYMDPPDGGDVSIAEQVSRMYRHVCDLQAENARLRGVLRQIEAQSIETFCINPEGGANIVVDGHERFAFESDVVMLLNIARAAMGEKE